MQFKVQFISADQTIPLRQKVLKPHLTASECYNPEDHLKTTFHLGVVYCNELVTVATFMLDPHPEISAGMPYRLRGMATEPRFWDQGFGAVILQEGVTHLKQIHSDLIWCNAREKAFGFYQKMGFRFLGPMFELPGIGPHKVMYKHLFPR